MHGAKVQQAGGRRLTARRHSTAVKAVFNSGLGLTRVAFHGISSSTAAAGALHLMLCLQRHLGEHGKTQVPAFDRLLMCGALPCRTSSTGRPLLCHDDAGTSHQPGRLPQQGQRRLPCHPRHHHTAAADPGVVTAVCVAGIHLSPEHEDCQQ